jgi:hypothetical protein
MIEFLGRPNASMCFAADLQHPRQIGIPPYALRLRVRPEWVDMLRSRHDT